MRYLLRSFKYFIQICLLLFVVLAILVAAGFVSKDINVMFTRGWTSVWMILGFFAAVSLIYPVFGYKRLRIAGSEAELLRVLGEYMKERGYKAEKDTPELKTFRLRSVFTKIFRLFEDRVTIEREYGSWFIEGATRDIVRIKSGLEYKMQFNPEEE